MKFTKSVFEKAKPQFNQEVIYCWYSDIWLPLIIQRHGFAPHGETKGYQVGLTGRTFETLAEAKKRVREIAAIEGGFGI